MSADRSFKMQIRAAIFNFYEPGHDMLYRAAKEINSERLFYLDSLKTFFFVEELGIH